MKKCFLNWNKDTVEDDVIFQHLYELSDGKINLRSADEDLRDASDLVRQRRRFQTSGRRGRSGGRGRKRH